MEKKNFECAMIKTFTGLPHTQENKETQENFKL